MPDIGEPALIAGASGGLGRELAIKFSHIRYGDPRVTDIHIPSNHVILSGRNMRALEYTRDRCADPANTTIVCGDLNDGDVLRQLRSFAHLYAIRYLICSAGEYLSGPLESRTSEEISDNLASNLAAIKLVREIYPVMLEYRTGTIVNINSVAGKNIAPDECVYSASKHALTGFFKSLRMEARKRNIRIMDVFPGGMNTPMAASRADKDYFISPQEAAQIIHLNATSSHSTVAVEELTLGRCRFQ